MEDDAARVTDLVPVGDALCTMVSDVASAKARLAELQDFVKQVMVPGEDYGAIPGTSTKPVLLKPGAEKLCEIYGLAQLCTVTQRVEDWDRPFFHYEVRCDLISKRTGATIGSGLGSCNSHEGRYRWREAQRVCPTCGQPAIIRGKEEFGGGWVCFRKRGGCGAKFGIDDVDITAQETGRVENDDIASQVNTILKMAKKRAVVDATLSVTRSSALFTQDEDVLPTPEPPPRPRGTTVAKRAAIRTLSEAQQQMILRRAQAAAISPAVVDEYVARMFHCASLDHLPIEHANMVLAWLDECVRGEPGTNG